MRKKLKLLTLAIACALLYDGCKPDDPEVITTINVELYDGKTQQPVPDVRFNILADFKGPILNPIYEPLDTARTDANGKFTKVFSSKKIGKIYTGKVYVDLNNPKWHLKYSGTQCPPFIDLCYNFYAGKTNTLTYYAY